MFARNHCRTKKKKLKTSHHSPPGQRKLAHSLANYGLMKHELMTHWIITSANIIPKDYFLLPIIKNKMHDQLLWKNRWSLQMPCFSSAAFRAAYMFWKLVYSNAKVCQYWRRVFWEAVKHTFLVNNYFLYYFLKT